MIWTHPLGTSIELHPLRTIEIPHFSWFGAQRGPTFLSFAASLVEPLAHCETRCLKQGENPHLAELFSQDPRSG